VIIAAAGYGQDEDRRRPKEAGSDRHLIKPRDPEALVSLLAAGGDGRGSMPSPRPEHPGCGRGDHLIRGFLFG
jgi:CheY-like chemotaxis protein